MFLGASLYIKRVLGHSLNLHSKQHVNNNFRKLNGAFSRAGILNYGDEAPNAEPSSKWLLNKILLDNLFDKEPVNGAPSTERSDVDDDAPLSKLLH